MNNGTPNPLVEYFRCPQWFAEGASCVSLDAELARRFGVAAGDPTYNGSPFPIMSADEFRSWIDLLRNERYEQASTETTVGAIMTREAYYLIRPLLGVAVRRHFQRFAFSGWDRRSFPHWPVDRTVDQLHEAFLRGGLQRKRTAEVPFIWFWPNGYSGCAVLTHDVETDEGLRFCPTLMGMDDAAGIKSSFQLVPEQRYHVSEAELEQFRARGFEVSVHDLNHDGHLYRDAATFRRRVGKINEYGRKFGAQGFRAGALYRNQEWFDLLDFQYDMSVPNVAHLDPQHGGCCTIFPYFIGNILELPVTAIQDYSLFHVLCTYSTELWREQFEEIARHHGMFHVITHPDYVIESRARAVYTEFLKLLSELARTRNVWLAQPRDVNAWWRQRSQMRLEWHDGQWRILGDGSERATVAYARAGEAGLEYANGPLTSRTASTPLGG
ncbi:MAG: hypothetical protein ACRD3E_17945 [Terriglobales bacterium]